MGGRALLLAYLRKGETFAELAADPGISTATAWIGGISGNRPPADWWCPLIRVTPER